jgi:hypothetical protein
MAAFVLGAPAVALRARSSSFAGSKLSPSAAQAPKAAAPAGRQTLEVRGPGLVQPCGAAARPAGGRAAARCATASRASGFR